jgi:LPXTG-site transpeptidase (sortase) family protein
MNAKPSHSFFYKTFTAVMIALLALTAMPVTPAYAADTGFQNPTSNAADTGGDGNGFEQNPTNAYADGGGNAANMDGAGDRHRYWGYNFGAIPPGAIIDGIEVRLDWWLDSTFGTNSMSVELSWNGGTSWTAPITDTNESTSTSNTVTLGSPINNWGHTWTVSELSSANFRVRLTSNSSFGTRDFFLDWVPVRVYYSLPTTTIGDGTSPSSKAVGASSTNNAVSSFTLSTNTGTDTITALVVTGGGTGLGNVAANGVKIYRDNGGTANEWDAGDTLIATASFAGTTATFTGLNIAVSTTSTQYIITYDIIASPTAGQTMTGFVSGATATTNPVTNNDNTDATLTIGYVITLITGAGGTIQSPYGTIVTGSVIVASGSSPTFYFDPNSGFIVEDVLQNSGSLGRLNALTIPNVNANHTLAVSFDGGWSDPSAFTNDNNWDNPQNMFNSDNQFATVSSFNTQTVDLTTFDIPTIPAGSTIDGIEVSIEGFTSGRQVTAQLSGNGGGSWTLGSAQTNFGSTEQTTIVGGPTDLWGISWAPSNFTNANFRVRMLSVSGGFTTVSVDQVEAKVHYRQPTTLTVSAATGTYGGTANLTATLTTTVGGNPVSGQTITFYLNGVNMGTAVTNGSGVATLNNVDLSGINAGVYPGTFNTSGVGASYAGTTPGALPGYLGSNGANTLTVNQAALTVTANDKTREYGLPNPTLDATITGFVNGETLGTSDVTGSPSCTTTATVSSPVGTYSITCAIGTLASNNYSFTFVQGTLTVTSADLLITASSDTMTYGGTVPTITPIYTGLRAGDTQPATPPTCTTTATSSSPVGSYTSSCSGAVDPNYNITYADGTVDVMPATLTVTANDKTREYGLANPALDATITGFVNGETLGTSDVTGSPSCTTTATISSPVSGSPYPITCTIGTLSSTNYTFTFGDGELTITEAALNITASSDTMTYGGIVPTITPIYTGLRAGDTEPATPPTCSTTATSSSPVGSYPSTCSGAADSNYNITYTPGTVTVTQAALTVTANDKTREYGSPNPLLDATITGFVNGETLGTSDVTGSPSCTTTATPSSPVTGNPYTITCTIGTLASSNYTFAAFNPGTLTITPATLTVTANDETREYGLANPVLDAAITGFVNGETLGTSDVTGSPSCTTSATVSSPVGTYAINCAIGTLASDNYGFTFAPGTLTVTGANLLITASSHTMNYGDPVPTITPIYTGLRAGDTEPATPPTCSTTATSTSPVGTYPSTCSGAADANYIITYAPGTVTIGANALLITASSDTMVYGGTVPTITPIYTGLQGGDTEPATPPTCSTTATSTSPVGSYTSSCSGAADPNYTITYATGTVTVTAASLNITASSETMIYGDPVPAITPIYAGFVAGDDETSLTTAPTCSTTATSTSSVGSYPSSCSGAVSANYTISYTAGTVTVDPRPITVTAVTDTKAYDGTTSSAGVPTITGTLVGTDTPNFIQTFDTPSVGTGKTLTPNGAVNDGNGGLNYDVTFVTDNTGVITGIAVTVTGITANNKIYDGTTDAALNTASAAITGVVPGDDVQLDVTGATGTFDNKNVGNGKTVTVSGLTLTGADAANYGILPYTTTANITTRAITVTAQTNTKVYDSTTSSATTPTITIGTLAPGDTANFTQTYNNPNVGTGKTLIPSGDVNDGNGGGNYLVTFVNNTTGVITARPLEITADPKTKAFGSPDPPLTYQITGGSLVGGDSVSGTLTRVAGEAVGTYAILQGSVSAGPNYNITYVGANLTITIINQTITVVTSAPANAAYNSSFNVAATASSGLPVAITTTGVCTGSGTNTATIIMVSGSGTCTVHYNQPGDSNYSPALEVLETTAAQKADQAIVVNTSAPANAIYNTSFNVSATATSGLPVAYSATGVCTNAASNFTMTSGTGACTVQYNQAGNANYNPAPQITETVNAQKANQTISVTTSAPGSAAFNSNFTVAATASSGLPIAYSAAGVCNNAGPTYTMTASTGTCSVLFNQAGNANYNAAPQITQTVNAQKANQTITITTSAPASAAYNSTFTVAATASSGLPVTFNAVGSCTNVGATFTMTSSTGTCTVQYDQAGNANYNPAPQITETVNAQKANQTINVTTSAPANAGFNSDFTVAATATSGLPVSYSASGACTNVGETFTMTASTGTCTVQYNQAGNANYNAAPQVTQTVNAQKGNQTITITTPAPAVAGFGSSFTVAATASSGLPVTYSSAGSCSNIGATFTMTASTGICTVQYDQAGDADYNAAPQMTESVNTQPADQTITVTTHAPANAAFNTSFTVAATASSGLPVVYSASGSCTNVGATFTVTVNSGTCTVHYNQPGDASYNPAPEVTESSTVFIDADAPTVTVEQAASQVDPTNVSPINFTVVFGEPVTGFTDSDVTLDGTAGANNATVTEIAPNDGTTYNVAVTGMTGDGTVIVSIPAGAAMDASGNPNTASTSTDNSVTYFDAGGPSVTVVNTIPDTGNGSLSNSETVTVRVTQFIVTFSQDVYNPVGDSDPDDVTNPNNYLLVRDLGDTSGFQTQSCAGGAATPADTQIAIGTISYNSATFTATFTVNNNLALTNGQYRLFVCGTTSIVDPLNTNLALVGNGGPNSDFILNFRVNIPTGGGGGGGGGGGAGGGGATAITGGLIPVTGFAPDKITSLPEQPESLAYSDTGGMWLEIPSLGVNVPIVGVKQTRNGWDLTWLGGNAGYLEGSAYPTWEGNTVLTAHVLDNRNAPGPFAYINELKQGDLVFIHFNGWTYVYQVEQSSHISPSGIETVFKHEEYSWLTLVTCEDYSMKAQKYLARRMVRAVLISVITDK